MNELLFRGMHIELLGQTRAPSKGHFTEQAEILHEKRITTSFVSESCMTLGNWNHEA